MTAIQFTVFILLAILFVGQSLLFFLFFLFSRKLDKKFNGANGKDILNLLADSIKKSEEVERSLGKSLKDIERDRAFLITSLYSKEGVRTYAKEVKEGVSEQVITQEEERALHQAMKK